MKSYDEMSNSIRFYRTIVVILISFIIFIGMNNVSTTQAADKYKEENQKLVNAQIAVNDFNEALMVRNDELEGSVEQLLEFTELYKCKGLK